MKKEFEYKNCLACRGKGKVKREYRFKPTEKHKKQILVLYRAGLGIREIQRKLKIRNPYTVSYYIKTCNERK